MSDSLVALVQAVASRDDAFVVGWRGETAIQNKDFLERIGAWRRLLQDRSGQHFALYLDDSIEFAAALLGAWLAAKTIWLTADILPASCQALRQSVNGFLGEFPEECAPLAPADVVPSEGDLSVRTDVSDEFIALVVHTSGTTGAAQAIPKRLSQLAAEVASLESLFGSRLGDAAIVATVSHQHIYGLLFKVLWPCIAGRPVHARRQNFPEELMHALSKSACVLVASPAYLKRLPEHLNWSNVSTQVAGVFSSGGPLPGETAEAVDKLLNRTPIEIYGSSETGGIAWRQRTQAAQDAWQPLPGVMCRASSEGLLEVRSPHLFDRDWLTLADRVSVYPDDRFSLQGRSDRIAKIEEKRISLDAIEADLLATGLVSDARIIVVDDGPMQRQRVAAFIMLNADGRDKLSRGGKLAMNRHLRDLLADAVDPVALPRRWRYLESMPLNAQGKTTHALLMAALGERPCEPLVRELARTASRVELQIIVPENLFYFDGHFNEAPILPGVVQVDWAIAKGREYFALPPHFAGMQALKFQHVIRPEQPVTLELTHDEQKRSLQFRYFSSNAQHASGRILFADDTHV